MSVKANAEAATNAAEIRSALAEFLGEDLFRKFVKAYSSRRRLRYWQEEVWNRFTAAHPQFQISDDLLDIVFQICHLHSEELRPVLVPAYQGCVDFSDKYNQAHGQLFPYACDFVSTEGRQIPDTQVYVLQCSACRMAKQQWESVALIGKRKPPAY